MSEPTSTPAPGSGNNPAEVPSTTPSAQPGTAEALTLDTVKGLIANVQQENARALEAQRNAIFAELRRSNKAPEKKETTAPASEEMKAIESLKSQLKQEKIKTALTGALATSGIDAKNQNKAFKYISALYANSLEINESGDVVFRESESVAKPLGDYITAWVKSDDGAIFLPPPQGPSGDGLRGSGAPVPTISKFRSMNYGQVMEARKTDPAGFKAYVEAHRDEFHQKRVEFERSGGKS